MDGRMIWPKYKYVDFAVGGADKRNNVITVSELPPVRGKRDVYRTVFRFAEDYWGHFRNNGSVSGFNGKCFLDWIPIDVDSSKLEDAYETANKVINILKYDFDYDVTHLFFSGAKGFHLLIPLGCFGVVEPSERLPNIVKGVVGDICGDLVDMAIYDMNRLFRMTNTVNGKSGLYKIPLTMGDFVKGVDHIRELAKTAQDAQFPSMWDVVKNPQFAELFLKYKFDSKTFETKNEIVEDFKGVGEGSRDETAVRIAGLLRAKGMEIELCYEILSGWNLRNSPPLPEKDVQKVLRSVYGYADKEEQETAIVPIWSVSDEYSDYISSDKGVKIGIDKIDEKIRSIRPGQVMTILGFTGNLKTATLQEILRYHHNRTGEPVVLFELEMSRLDLFERAVQMESGIGGHEVEKLFKGTGGTDQITLLKDRQKDYYIVDKAGLTFEEMGQFIAIGEEKVYKRKTGLVGLDFIQLMSAQGATNAERVNSIAKGMKNFAKKVNVPLIVVSQVTGVKDETTALKLMDARDSKTVAITSDFVVGLWIDETEEERKVQIVALQKNRKGGLCRVEREVDQKSLQFKVLGDKKEPPPLSDNDIPPQAIEFGF